MLGDLPINTLIPTLHMATEYSNEPFSMYLGRDGKSRVTSHFSFSRKGRSLVRSYVDPV